MRKLRPTFYRIRNWDSFQQYKDRNPKWVKLHYETLHSADWVTADTDTRVLMIVCMLVASRHGGNIPNDMPYLKRVGYLEHEPTLTKLVTNGFLSPPKYLRNKDILVRDARLETETETETDKKEESRALTRSKRTRIGEYLPSEFEQAKATAYWRAKGRDDLTAADQVERFTAFHTAKGTTMAEWPRAWQTWYMNALQFSKGTGHERKPTAHENLQRGTLTALKRITGE